LAPVVVGLPSGLCAPRRVLLVPEKISLRSRARVSWLGSRTTSSSAAVNNREDWYFYMDGSKKIKVIIKPGYYYFGKYNFPLSKRTWCRQVCSSRKVDHVVLRRQLIWTEFAESSSCLSRSFSGGVWDLWACKTNPVGGSVLGKDGLPFQFKSLDVTSEGCTCLET